MATLHRLVTGKRTTPLTARETVPNTGPSADPLSGRGAPQHVH